MTEIKFKLVDGEPVCTTDCPSWNKSDKPRDCHQIAHPPSPCIPGLRQQRDEARADLATLKITSISDGRGGFIDGYVNGSEYKNAHEGRRVALERLDEVKADLAAARAEVERMAKQIDELRIRALLTPVPATEGGEDA